jgi:hypothetical protein
MGGIVDWLRVFRAQTSPASFLLAVASYYAGGGSSLLMVGVLVVIGALVHWASFGSNSLTDVAADRADPFKQHHPLVSGRIPEDRAVRVLGWMQMLLLLVLCWLARGDWVGTLGVAVFGVCGYVYNFRFAKVSVWGWVPITLSFGGLSVWAMRLGGHVNPLFLGWVCVQLVFQIDWSGRLKDLTTSEPSWMKLLGARITNGMFLPGWSLLYAFELQVAQIALGTALLHAAGARGLPMVVVAALLGIVVGLTWARLALPRFHSRVKDLRNMALHEVAATFIGLFAVAPFWVACALAAFGFVWFVFFNRILWGTVVAPRV